MEILSAIEENLDYMIKGNVYGFIHDESERPEWSKRLNGYFTENGTDLKMQLKYQLNRQKVSSPSCRRFFDYISEKNGITVDLASGPSGYFGPLLDTLCEDNALIVTDACPAVVNALSSAFGNPGFYVFDVDLDKALPFKDESITAFSGNLLNNVDNYSGLLEEAYRCLKPGGRLAVIEMFFELGGKTYCYLNERGAVWASFETFVDSCRKIGFTYIDSEIIGSRTGKISKNDLLPLDDDERSADRTVYFEK